MMIRILVCLFSLTIFACADPVELTRNEAKQKSFEESGDFCLVLGWYRDGHCDMHLTHTRINHQINLRINPLISHQNLAITLMFAKT